MNSNLRIKPRNAVRQEVQNRRIKTQMNDSHNRISFNLIKPKQPLAENKKIINQTDTQIKNRAKPIKSISIKNNPPVTNMTTEPIDKGNITNSNKIMMDRIFGGGKKQAATLGLSLTSFQKNKETGKESSRMAGISRYVFEDKLDSGAFGTVHRARDRKTLEIVAIKKVFQDKKYKNRQLQILKMLNHPNVLKIRDSFYTSEGEKEYLNVVMDFFPGNLFDSIQKYRNKSQIPKLKLKVLAYQMFRGLHYLNAIGIAHRDIKPQNILVNDNNWNLLICDFGSAKKLQPNEPNLAYICSRCYRAPQLIFGSTSYTTQIDMWSAGCVLVEMITFIPIFRSESNIDQLVEIIKVLGTPSHEEMLEMNSQCDVGKYQFPKIGARSWEKILKKKYLGEEFYDLLSNVLKYSPHTRFTPFQALCHPFFDELRNQEVYTQLRRQYNLSLFDFRINELTAKQTQKLIPAWFAN